MDKKIIILYQCSFFIIDYLNNTSYLNVTYYEPLGRVDIRSYYAFFVTHYLRTRNLEQDGVAILMLIKTMHKRMFYMKRNHLKLIL